MKVLDNIYVAINFGLANCIMIEGEDGVIIIDTMEGPEPAREVLEEFRRITDKPIVGIILTHFHADHVYGIETFLAAAGPGVEVVSHSSLPQQLAQVVNVRGGVTYQRAVRQFGTEVPDTVKKAGIGPNLKCVLCIELQTIHGF